MTNKLHITVLYLILNIFLSPVFAGILYQYNISNIEDFNIKELRFVEPIKGGAGGVLVFQDRSGKRWTFKSWKGHGHGVTENLGSILLNEMGLKTPGFLITNDLPEQFKNSIPPTYADFIKNTQLFRFAEFIDGRHPNIEKYPHFFDPFSVAVSLISWWDRHPRNIMIGHDNTLYAIDTGGSLLHHALGEVKEEGRPLSQYWSKYQITEFQEKTIPNEQIIQQIIAILPKSSTILSLADTFCRRLSYERREEILAMLSSRLQHMELLARAYYNQICSFSDPFAYGARGHDSAASMLWTIDAQNRPYVVLKRGQTGQFGCMSVASEADELFAETAARAIRRETNDSVTISPQSLLSSPSHEVVHINENLMLARQRTYLSFLSPHAAAMVDRTHFGLFPISYLRNSYFENSAMAQTPFTPSFISFLSTAAAQNWFNHLLHGPQPPSQHTRSLINRTNLEEVQPFVINPISVSLNQIFNAAINSPNLRYRPEEFTERSKTFCASDYMLRTLREKKSLSENTYPELIRALYPELSLHESQMATVFEALHREREYSHDFTVHYHATSMAIWFSYRVLSVIDHLLRASPMQTDRLRSFDSFFERFPDALALKEYILKGHDNYSPGFQSCGIACNPTLFSNIDQKTSSTFDIFFSGNARKPPQNPLSIVELVLKEFKFPDYVLTEIQKLYEEISSRNEGALLQIFTNKNPEQARNMFYVAGTLGSVWDKNRAGIDDPHTIVANFQQGKIAAQQNEDHVQTRLHVNFANLGPALIFDYFSETPINTAQLDNKIDKIIRPHLFYIYKHTVYNSNIYNGDEISSIHTLRNTLNISKTNNNSIYNTYTEKDVFKLHNLLFHKKSELDNLNIIEPDSLEQIPLKNTYVKDLLELSEEDLSELKALVERFSLPKDYTVNLLSNIARLPQTKRTSTIKKAREFIEENSGILPTRDTAEIHQFIMKAIYTASIYSDEPESIVQEIFLTAISLNLNKEDIKEFPHIIGEKIFAMPEGSRHHLCNVARSILSSKINTQLMPNIFDAVTKHTNTYETIDQFLRINNIFNNAFNDPIYSNNYYPHKSRLQKIFLFFDNKELKNPDEISSIFNILINSGMHIDSLINILDYIEDNLDSFTDLIHIIQGHSIYKNLGREKDSTYLIDTIEFFKSIPKNDGATIGSATKIFMNIFKTDDGLNLLLKEIYKLSEEKREPIAQAIVNIFPTKNYRLSFIDLRTLISIFDKLEKNHYMVFSDLAKKLLSSNLEYCEYGKYCIAFLGILYKKYKNNFENMKHILPITMPNMLSNTIEKLFLAIGSISEENRESVANLAAKFNFLSDHNANHDYDIIFQAFAKISEDSRDVLSKVFIDNPNLFNNINGHNTYIVLILLAKINNVDYDNCNAVINLILEDDGTLIDQTILNASKVIALAHDTISFDNIALMFSNLKKITEENKNIGSYVISARKGIFDTKE